LKQALQIGHSQRLQLTPQLQQSIRLLQMSYADLTQEISVAMESNPFLEEAESTGPDAPLPDLPVVDTDEESALEDRIHADRDDPNEHYWDSTATSERRWDESSQASSSFDPFSSVSVSAESQWQNPPDGMTQVLLGELALHRLSESDQWIARALIGCLDPQGYLTVDYDELRQILAPQAVPEDSEINSVLHLLQQLSWPGIGARDLRECLTLQLSALDPDTPELNTAQRLVETHLALLSAHRYDELVRLLDIDRPTLARALALIHSLDPKPGERLFEQVATSIIPDAMVRRQGDRWTTSLTQENARRVQLNDHYRQYLRGQDPPTQKYLQENLRNAQWFIRSLEQRDSTILRVAREIVDVQQGFMDNGDSALVPLTMRVVAQQLELHESTISRAVDQKHLLTPHGVYPLKYFFSGGVGESSGPATSARAVQARIRKVIESEAPLKPVSDSQLVTILDNQGIQIARRTVAKYREQMNIPPATQRRSVL
jgi:RNA polymerase sigma-54 factor